MPVKVSQRVADTFARDRLAQVIVEELPVREPLLTQMDAPRLRQLAQHCATQAIHFGFDDPNAALYFSLVMVRMHPQFYDQPQIAAALRQLADERVPSASRPSLLDERVPPTAWQEAIDRQPMSSDEYWARFFLEMDRRGQQPAR